MHRLIRRPLRLLVVLLFICDAEQVGWCQERTQSRFTTMLQSGFEGSSHIRSRPGTKITSYPCDPLMTQRRESELLELLHQPTPFAWENQLTIATLAQDLGKVVPVVVDTRSLEELGIELSEEFDGGKQLRQPPSPQGSTAEDASNTAKAWWTRSKQTLPLPIGSPSLLVDITERLRTLDLEILIRHGRVIITTSETAEEAEIVRLYDVTPLIGDADEAESNVTSHDPWQRKHGCYDRIVDTIETMIEPSAWVRLGGESAISPMTVRDRHWLAISTSTMIHLRIQRLLDQFNQDASRRY